MKKAAKLIDANPKLEDSVNKTLRLLESNPFDPSLKTHKLEGRLKDKYSCSLTDDLRIVFKLIGKVIHLINVGPHGKSYRKRK
jgi:addiction module RelE/StbE family toxin